MKPTLICTGALTMFAAALTAGDWPQWRGPARDGKAVGEAILPAEFPTDLQPRWKIAVGPGHSSPVVAGGKIVYLDEKNGMETVHATAADTGVELWAAALDEVFGDEWGSGPRSTPIIDGDRVYVQSCQGEFRCLNLADGKVKWRTNFEQDYGVKFLGSKANEGTATRRGNNGSGVADAERIYLPVGNTAGASVVAFDKFTGKEAWRSQNDEAAYSSFITGTLAGTRQVVALTADALIGLEPAHGKLLWRVPFKTNAKRHAATPVILGDDIVVVNSHTIGMVATRITKDGEDYKPVQAWANPALKVNLATPVVVDGYLYVQGASKDFVCVDGKSGAIKWSQAGFGTGKKDYSSTIAVGKQLLVLTEDGTLLLLAATPEKYTELSRLQACGNTWSFPAFAGGRLYVRDARNLACFDLQGLKTASTR